MTTHKQNYIYTYKYLPFNDNCLKTITEGTISFTCPLDFNDPFDCNPYQQIPDIKTLKKNRPDLFKLANTTRKKQHLRKLTDTQMYRNMHERFVTGFREQEMSKVGIVSLSSNALSPLMWSHYANSHRGFVLEFKTPEKGVRAIQVLINFDNLVSLPVDYTMSRPTIHVGLEPNESLVDKLYLTKSSDWKYESEYRVIDYLRKPGVHHYARDKVLCSVIAGARIEKDKFEQLSNAVNAVKKSIPDLRLFKAKLSDHKFKVVVQQHPRLK